MYINITLHKQHVTVQVTHNIDPSATVVVTAKGKLKHSKLGNVDPIYIATLCCCYDTVNPRKSVKSTLKAFSMYDKKSLPKATTHGEILKVLHSKTADSYLRKAIELSNNAVIIKYNNKEQVIGVTLNRLSILAYLIYWRHNTSSNVRYSVVDKDTRYEYDNVLNLTTKPVFKSTLEVTLYVTATSLPLNQVLDDFILCNTPGAWLQVTQQFHNKPILYNTEILSVYKEFIQADMLLAEKQKHTILMWLHELH